MERDTDIYRIIGQLEATITGIVNADKDCRMQRGKDHDAILSLISNLKKEIELKYDKSEAIKMSSEIDKLRDVLNLDNSDNVKNNLSTMNKVIAGVIGIIAIIGFIVSIVSLVHGK